MRLAAGLPVPPLHAAPRLARAARASPGILHGPLGRELAADGCSLTETTGPVWVGARAGPTLRVRSSRVCRTSSRRDRRRPAFRAVRHTLGAMPAPSAAADFATVCGVDFSGARLAGRNTWVAEVERTDALPVLRSLRSLEQLAGAADRDAALAWLIERVATSQAAWALDFPFSVPPVLLPGLDWLGQLAWVTDFAGDAPAFGHDLLARAKALGGANHIRRRTDADARTPFDSYHYRIVYQTFHGMRDVLAPLARRAGVAVLPYGFDRLRRARRLVMEACPSSTLKRLDLPHHRYKQPAGGPLTRIRRQTRRRILDGLAEVVEFTATDRRRMMRNPGGDAIDAVLAACGAVHELDRGLSRHPSRRQPCRSEGYIFH